jgi:hypothetical protein
MGKKNAEDAIIDASIEIFTGRRLLVRVLAGVLVCSAETYAARPLVTDDARVVAPKACQLETWVRRNRESTEYWALPACNPTGNLEITFGGALTRELGATHVSDLQIQGKTIFRKLETDNWGIGLAVGHLSHPQIRPRRDLVDNLYGYVPASFSFGGDAFVLHTNAGVVRPDDESRHRITWGVGSEIRLHPRFYLIPEIFSQTAGRPHYQAGLRYWLIPERVQIDATYGDRLGSGGERWFSIGLRLLSRPFLP